MHHPADGPHTAGTSIAIIVSDASWLKAEMTPTSLTAACLTAARGIDIARFERLVKDTGDARQLLLFQVGSVALRQGAGRVVQRAAG